MKALCAVWLPTVLFPHTYTIRPHVATYQREKVGACSKKTRTPVNAFARKLSRLAMRWLVVAVFCFTQRALQRVRMSTSMSPSAWLADFEALLKCERDRLACYYGLSAVLSSSNAWGVVLLVKRGYGPDQVSRQHCICCVTCGSRELTNGTTRRVPQRTRDVTTKRLSDSEQGRAQLYIDKTAHTLRLQRLQRMTWGN